MTSPSGAGLWQNPLIAPSASFSHSTPILVEQSQVVGAGATVTLGPFPILQPGWEALFQGLANATGSTLPFVECQVIFTDSQTGMQVGQESVFVPMGVSGSGNPVPVYGSGNANGDQVAFKFTNLDTIACTMQVTFAACSKTFTRNVWQEQGGASGGIAVPYPNQARPNMGAFGSDELWSLGTYGTPNTLAGGGTVATRLLPVYNGTVHCHLNGSGLSANQLAFRFFTLNGITGHAGQSCILFETFVGNTTVDVDVDICCPKENLILQLTNNNANTATYQAFGMIRET